MASAASSTLNWSAEQWRDCQLAHLPGYDPYATGEGYHFDIEAANDAISFFQSLEFIEGERAGDKFILEDWQRAIVGSIFGWKNEKTGLRRYREAFVYVARKNGKSPLAAGIVLIGLFVDGEPGAQIYSAAAEREQAALVYRHASAMIARDPQLGRLCKTYKTFKSIEVPATNSVYKALSADADTKHGFSTHMVIVDELHAHPNGELVDVLQTSMGARREPIMIHITTADYDRDSVCNRKYDYACKVREGVFEDASFLPVIYEAGRDDDWTKPDTWKKANPNMGVSVRTDYLERECERAKNEPSYENTFKRLHLNIRTQQDIRWIQLDRWDKCSGGLELDSLAGRECWGGLDLSSTTDVSAFVLAFPPLGDEPVSLLGFYWVPAENARARERKDRVPYLTWEKSGAIRMTPGNVIDYDRIRNQISEIGETYNIREIAVDRWNSTQLQNQLMGDGFNVVQFGQGFASMTAPTKELEKLIMAGKLEHFNCPVLRWMAGNVAAEIDAAGNIKPSKKKSSEKIDGIVASVMALGVYLNAEQQITGMPNFASH